jgi:hypothetical protein
MPDAFVFLVPFSVWEKIFGYRLTGRFFGLTQGIVFMGE